jgi:rod shape-determining protein MreD
MNARFFKEISYSKLLTYLVFYLVVTIYESLFSELFRIGPARLDLSLLLLIYVTLSKGTKEGILFGFWLGLLLDSMTPLWLGLGILIKTGLSYLIGVFRDSLYLESIPSKILLVFIVIMLSDLARSLFLNHFNLDRVGISLWQTSLFSAIYTTAVAALALLINRREKPRVLTVKDASF